MEMDFEEEFNKFLLFVYVVVVPVTLMYLILTGKVSLAGMPPIEIFALNLYFATASVVLALLIFSWLKDNL